LLPALSAGVEDERATVLLEMPLDAQRPVGLASLLHRLMWSVPCSANGLRLRSREGFALHGI
jgi:hypothetical protein